MWWRPTDLKSKRLRASKWSRGSRVHISLIYPRGRFPRIVAGLVTELIYGSPATTLELSSAKILPHAIAAFTDPVWKGRLALEATDSDWMYGVVNYLGEERGIDFFRKLSALRPEMRKGHILVAQLLAAGELSVCLTVYSGNAESIKSQGGSIDWLPVEPLVGRPQGLALARHAAHPYAALLFADFVLSPQGMRILNNLGRVPSSRTQKTLLDSRAYVMIDPAKWMDEAGRWEKIWNELFLR